MTKRVAKPYRTPGIYFGTTEPAREGTKRTIREELSVPGKALLDQLLGKVKLTFTAENFPHVINQLAIHSHNPQLMLRKIDELLLPDDSRKRQGFPFETVLELGNLKELYGRYLR